MVSPDEATRRQATSQNPPPPTWNLHDLQDILDNPWPGAEMPVLRIEVTDIKDRKAQFREYAGESEPPTKKARITFIHAQCSLTIWQCGSGNQAKLIEQTKECTIQARTKESGERTASVSMDEPFYVKVEQLQLDDGKNPKKLLNQAYNVQITILVASLSEPWPPFKLGLTPTPKVPVVEEASGIVRLPMLVAKWHKFPNCPEKLSDSLLEATAWQDKTTYKPKLSFKIKAAWGLPPNPLETYNARLRSKSKSPPHLPSPISEAESDKRSIRIRWIFEGNWEHIKTLEFTDYICPLCNGMKLDNMDLFHFHLTQNHDLFTFALNKVRFGNSGPGQQEIYAEVSVDANVRPRVRGGSKAPDERVMDWEKSNTIFDLQKHLKQIQDQVSKESRKTIPRTSSNLKESSKTVSGGDPVADNLVPKASRRSEAVPDMPDPDRRRFRVPRAPDGVKFYRLVSKRPLGVGEEISESDDDIDETWLLHKHNDIIKSFSDMSMTEKEFICRYDEHMLSENLSSHVHFREALVRFCRTNRTWLQKPEMRREFHSNLANLLLQGVIPIQLIGDCEKIIQTSDEIVASFIKPPSTIQAPSESGHSRNPSKEKSRSPTEPFHTYGTCVCGVKLYKLGDLIRCVNIVSICPGLYVRLQRANYHRTAKIRVSTCHVLAFNVGFLAGYVQIAAPMCLSPALPKPRGKRQLYSQHRSVHFSVCRELGLERLQDRVLGHWPNRYLDRSRKLLLILSGYLRRPQVLTTASRITIAVYLTTSSNLLIWLGNHITEPRSYLLRISYPIPFVLKGENPKEKCLTLLFVTRIKHPSTRLRIIVFPR